MKIKRLLPPLFVILGVALLTAIASSTAVREEQAVTMPASMDEFSAAVQAVDDELQRRWEEQGLSPAPAADDLQVLRRLSLALHGTIPSLEEIRLFEADERSDRLSRWTAMMLDDTRFSDYFAERLARSFVGVEEGQFVIFRRDRFTHWLREQLRPSAPEERRPYDAIVRDMIAGRGVWTGKGQVNFLTAGFANDDFDENKLTARTVRAFLGQRIDCAQCHDHPYDTWTQDQFEGLAAHYGQVGLTLAGLQDEPGHLFDLPSESASLLVDGDVTEELRQTFREHDHNLRKFAAIKVVRDDSLWLFKDSDESAEGLEPHYIARRTPDGLSVSSSEGEYLVEDRETLEQRLIDPAVPFHSEWLGTEGSRRDRLAVWVTHPKNKRFERAIANRVWGLLFGRPFLSDRHVDDLPSPEQEEYADDTRVLDILGRDFREHNCDLRRLIQVITATRSFRMDSIATTDDSYEIDAARQSWAVFPITRRRPEQVVGAILQANSIKTIDQNSHLFVRFRRFISEQEFVNEYGDLGENELEDRAGTISQALLRMNGKFAREMTSEEAFSAPGRIAGYSSTPEKLLENCFLACLTRRPTPEESAHFLPQLQGEEGHQKGVVQDIYWALFNSPEF
ncbi:MAG: DUF1549 domain-containing protein [Planctomycetaceae bacterium]|nr:DUF1549 domain-containing protein [Planctomycetaceae bacterium]